MDNNKKNNMISLKKKWVKTDAWRGYEQPISAVCGANDTGMWADSPCRTDVCKAELNAIMKLFTSNGIKYRQSTCQSSNVFCVHRYICVAENDKAEAYVIVGKYLEGNDTDLLYKV
jgi:hypothetical protein